MHSDMIDTNIQDENEETLTQSIVTSSSEQRLDKAFLSIEKFLIDKKSQVYLKNKDVVLANLDVLIARVQDVLQQSDTVE